MKLVLISLLLYGSTLKAKSTLCSDLFEKLIAEDRIVRQGPEDLQICSLVSSLNAVHVLFRSTGYDSPIFGDLEEIKKSFALYMQFHYGARLQEGVAADALLEALPEFIAWLDPKAPRVFIERKSWRERIELDELNEAGAIVLPVIGRLDGGAHVVWLEQIDVAKNALILFDFVTDRGRITRHVYKGLVGGYMAWQIKKAGFDPLPDSILGIYKIRLGAVRANPEKL